MRWVGGVEVGLDGVEVFGRAVVSMRLLSVGRRKVVWSGCICVGLSLRRCGFRGGVSAWSWETLRLGLGTFNESCLGGGV